MNNHRVVVTSHGDPAVLQVMERAPFFPTLDKLARSDNAWYRATLSGLLDLLATGEIRPVVAERVPLAEAARAHELLERGGQAGKVVLIAAGDTGSAQEGDR